MESTDTPSNRFFVLIEGHPPEHQYRVAMFYSKLKILTFSGGGWFRSEDAAVNAAAWLVPRNPDRIIFLMHREVTTPPWEMV